MAQALESKESLLPSSVFVRPAGTDKFHGFSLFAHSGSIARQLVPILLIGRLWGLCWFRSISGNFRGFLLSKFALGDAEIYFVQGAIAGAIFLAAGLVPDEAEFGHIACSKCHLHTSGDISHCGIRPVVHDVPLPTRVNK